MESRFLPKELSGIGTRKYIVDYQTCRSYTGLHWHDCIEIVYVEKGYMRVFFNDKWHELRKGDLVFVPPHQIHYMLCENDETIKTVIGVSKSIICDLDIQEENVLLPFENDQIYEHCFLKDNGEVEKIVNRLNSIEKTYTGELLIQAEILRLYVYIYNEWLKKGISFIEPIKDKDVHKIFKTLENDFTYPPSAEKMAETLGMSYSHMCRILKEKTGTSYTAILNSVRIENAKKLLVATDKSITEIGTECGFENSSYFIKMFRKTVGTTPNRYRKLTREISQN